MSVMLRRLGIAVLVALSPVVLAYIFMVSTHDPDQGANIGGGIAVLFSVPLGIVAAVVYLVASAGDRT
jgi:hypothetical protein